MIRTDGKPTIAWSPFSGMGDYAVPLDGPDPEPPRCDDDEDWASVDSDEAWYTAMEILDARGQ